VMRGRCVVYSCRVELWEGDVHLVPFCVVISSSVCHLMRFGAGRMQSCTPDGFAMNWPSFVVWNE